MNRLTFTLKPVTCFLLMLVAFNLLTVSVFAQVKKQPIKNQNYLDVLKKSENSISFQENKGQWPANVQAIGNTNVGKMVIKKDELYFVSFNNKETHEQEGEREESKTTEAHSWGISFDGFNPDYTVAKANELPTKYNYFIGPENHASDVSAYGEMALQNMYPGVDLRMYSQKDNKIEFDWLVSPGADYRNIKMRFKGQDGLRVNEQGDLEVKLRFDNVAFDIPEAYQLINGKKVMVKMKFEVTNEVASFKAEDNIDANYPLIIDPSLKWGTWMDGDVAAFDEYLFAVDVDASGNVYCGGHSNVQIPVAYLGTGSYGYDPSFNGSTDGIVYEIKTDGTVLMRVTYFGSTSDDGIYGLALSPDQSTVFICGFTSGAIPSGTTASFDNTLATGTDGFVASFNSTLGVLNYSSYIGGPGTTDRMVSIRSISNTSYVVAGRMGAAPTGAPTYIATAADATYSGGDEMYIAKFSTLNTLAWGTWVGGNVAEDLNDMNLFSDGAVAFSGFTASTAATFPTLVNSAGTASTNQDAVVGVIPSAGGSFSMLSRIGGTGTDEFNGLVIGLNDTIFVTGLNSGGNFPLGTGALASNRFSIVNSGSNDCIIGKIPRDGKPGVNDPWIATYYGGSGDDRGNTIRTYAFSTALMIFGETQSANFPTLNLNQGGNTFFSNANQGGWDICWVALGTNLQTQLFSTYVGGPQNDYLGETGEPAGSNHFVVEGDSLIVLGTTVHSGVIVPNVIGPTSGPGTVFDITHGSITTSRDVHLIFKWRVGAIFNYDNGDAPISYGTGRHLNLPSLKLGATTDPEDFYPAAPGTKANVDDLNGTTPDDEDAISGTQILIQDTATQYSVTIPITNTTGLVATVAAWIDFNRNGTFDLGEQDTVRVASGATSATLRWTGFSFSSGLVDTSYLRIRISTDATMNVANPPNNINFLTGEVEDYLVVRFHCVNLTGAVVTTSIPTTCGGNNGSITITVPPSQLSNGTYTVSYKRGITQFGPFSLNAAGGVITIPNLSAGTYTTIVIFSPTNPQCGDTLDGPIVITDPVRPASPTAGSNSPICVTQTLLLTASTVAGATYQWIGPAGFASTSQNPSIPNVTTANAGTYKVVAKSPTTLCVSDTATVVVVINTIAAAPTPGSNSPVCEAGTINLTANGAGGAIYSWTGPLSFTSSQQNPSLSPATLGMAGSYCVSQNVLGCVSPQACTTVVVNPKPVISAIASTNPTTCGGSNGTITITGLVTGQSYTINYLKGGVAQTPIVQIAAGGQVVITGLSSGNYTNFTVTLGLCTSNVFAGPVVVTTPTTPLAPGVSSNSPVCEGDDINLFATGEPTASFTWSGQAPLVFNSNQQNPVRTNATLAMAGTYCAIQTDSACPSAQACVTVVVNAKPVITTAVGFNPITCGGTTGTITLSGLVAGQAYSFTYLRNGVAQNGTLTANGSGQIIITGLNAASYTNFIVTRTSTTCVSNAFAGPVVLSNPTTPAPPGVSSNSPVCENDAINLFATGESGATFSWTGQAPLVFNSSQQNPIRTNATLAMTGTYCVTQTDSGCTSNQACVAVLVKPRPVITGTSNTDPTTCLGSNGTITINGLTPNTTFTITYTKDGSPQSQTVTSNGSGQAVLIGLTEGDYANIVVTLNGCSSATLGGIITLSDPVTPSAPVVSSNSPVCEGFTINLNATGVSGATYSWTGQAPLVYSSSQQNPTRPNATLAMAGTYCVTQTVAACTSIPACTNVVVNANPVVTSTSSTGPTTCGGTNGSVTLNGLIAGQVYLVTYLKNGVPQSISIQANGSGQVIIANLTIGTYSNIVVSLLGCVSVAAGPVTLNNPTGPNPPTATTNAPVCEGFALSVGVNATAGGTYLWSGPFGFNSGSQNPLVSASATVAMSGTYKVVVTLNACQDSSTVNVTVNSNPIANAGSGGEYCSSPGGSVILGGSPTASGGSGSYGYLWSPNTNLNSTTSSNPVANPSSSTTYTVTVTDGNGCTATSSASVNINLNPTADAGPASSSTCNGGSVAIGGSPTGSGGTPGYTYSWSNGAAAFANPTVSPTSTTPYTVTVTDSKGCTATASTVVIINQHPIVDAGPDRTVQSCDTVGIVIGGSPTAVSGTGPFSYLWSPAAGLTDSSLANPTLRNIGSTSIYTVVVTDGNGCTGSDDMLVNVTGSDLGAVIVENTSLTWCQVSNPPGEVTLTAIPTGGTQPYSFIWTGVNSLNQTGPWTTVTPNVPGNYIYSVVVTDGTGCQSGASIVVNVLTSPTADAGPSYTICNGQSVTLGGSPTAGLGTAPYLYTWSVLGVSPVSNPTVSPIATTTYIITVTDTLGCTATASATVTVNPNPIVDAGSDQSLVSCNILGITLGGSPTATGSTAPYGYLWSPATGLSSATDANPTLSGIGSSGTYIVTVTDDNGCTASDAIAISVTGGSLTVVIIPNTPIAWCAETGDDVTFTAVPLGGSLPYTYTWTGANLNTTSGNNVTANPTVPGTYEYTVDLVDATGCHAGDTIVVTIYPSPSADGGVPVTVCAGTSVTLGGSPTAIDGTPGYTYTWDGGAAFIANPSIIPVSSTTYHVTVTDSHGCIDTSSKIVTVNPKPVADAGSNVTIPGCSPTGLPIGGSPTASGGTPGYTYSWSPTAFLSSASVSNPTVAGITATNTYTVVVTDTNGCTASDQTLVTITNNPPSASISAGGNTSWCLNSGDSVDLTVSVSGGQASFSYSWSGTDINPTNAQIATVTTNTLGANVYTVTVTDAFNCTASATRTITVNPNPVADAGVDESICSGTNVTLGGSPTASAGTPGYTYVWTGGTGAGPVANPIVTPLSTSTYTVVVTDANGCTATASKTVTIKPNPVADAGPNRTLSSCSPTGIDIGGSPTASGGGGAPYTYSWSPTGGLSDATISNPTVSGITVTTTYTVTVTDAGGCTATDQVLVTVVNTSPSVSISSSNGTQWCAGTGSSSNLTASVTGATGSLTYAWSGSFINPLNAQIVTVNPNTAGTYTYDVTVTDGFNCTGSATFTITVNPNPVASTIDDTVCFGGSLIIGGRPTATGGTPGYTYSWNNGASPVANPTVSPFSTTTYVVTVTDSKGCSATSAETVTVNPSPVADAGPDKTLVSCLGDTVTLGGSPTAFGGSGSYYTYAWSPSTGMNDSTLANPQVSGVTATGTYCVTITDATGCTSTDCVTITVVQSSLQAQAATNSTYCAGSVPFVNVGGTPTASGGTPPYTYSWNGVGLSATNVPNPTAQPTATETYCVTVTDANGCSASSCTTITINPIPVANAGTDTAICNGVSVAIGGPATSGYSYSWSPAFSLSSITASNPTANPIFTTTYCVTVTDGNSCSASSCVTITIRPNPVADAGGDVAISACPGDSVQLGGSPTASGGTPAYTCFWTPSTGLSDPNTCNPYFKSPVAGTFLDTLTVTDANGCSSSDVVRIFVRNSNLSAEAGNGASVCAGGLNPITLGGIPTAIGGDPPYVYSWTSSPAGFTDNTANPVVLPLVTTTYYVTLFDARGCSATDSAVVTINPLPVANAGADTSLCASATMQIGGNPTATGGTPGYTYNWGVGIGLNSTTIPNPIATAFITSSYCITVTDSKGCTASDCITITVRQNPIADAGADKTMPACDSSCVQIGGSPTGFSAGGGLLTYSWTPSASPPLDNASLPNPNVCNLGTNSTYTVVVTDQYGCSASDQVFIAVTGGTIAVDAGPDASFCAGSPVSVVLGGNPVVVGGTAPYTYTWSSIPASGLIPSVAHPVVSPTVTTTYYVQVTDANGCVGQDSVRITINPSPVVTPLQDITICSGETALLGENPTATGGTGTLTYYWGTTTGLNSSTGPNPNAVPVVTTTYCVTVTDALHCSASACQTVTVNPKPVADAGPDKTMINCPGSSAQIGGSPTASGGSGSYSWQWTPNAGLNSASIPNPIVTGLTQTTTYIVVVTDNLTGCTDSDQVVITVNQTTLVADAGCDRIRCANSASCTVLGGLAPCSGPTASGGVFPYTYQWGPGFILSVSNPCVAPTLTGDFYVTVTDAVGCFKIDTITVTVDPVINVNAGTDTAICTATDVVLGGSPTASGGTGSFTYSWAPPDFLSGNNISNPTAVRVDRNITYGLIVTDSLGCSATDVVHIDVRQRPIANAGPDGVIFACNPDSLILGGTPTATGTQGPYTYLWTPSFNIALSCSTCANPVLDSLGAQTTFCVTIKDFFGCTAIDCEVVSVLPNTVFVDAGPTQSMCADNLICVTLDGTVSGGTPGYTYEWLLNRTDSIANVQRPLVCPTDTTTYELIATDSRGCQASDITQVFVIPAPILNIVVTPNDTVCKNQSVTLCPNYGNDVVNIQYAQLGGNTFASGLNCVSFIPIGVDFSVVATAISSTGCIKRDTILIHVNQNPVAIDDNGQTCEEQAVSVDVSANDTDPEGNSGTVTVVSSPHGTTTVSGGTITYTPALNYNGTDVVTYVICNTQCLNACDTGTLTIAICPVNDPPVAQDVTASTCRDSAVVVTMNNTDVDSGDVLTATDISCAALNGTITNLSVGGLTYTPSAGFVGSQTICIQVCDTSGACDTATISITVLPCNHAPIAVDDLVDQLCNSDTLDIKVLGNDTDPDGDALTVTGVIQPAASGGGTLTFTAGGVTYHPGTATGTITMSYIVCDNGTPSLCDTATITVTVIPCIIDITGVSDTICMGQTSRTCVGKNVTSTFPWKITTLCDPQNGTVAFSSDSLCFNYTPNQAFVGNDTFCITITDSAGHTRDTIVIMTTIDCLIQAVDEPCDLTETPLNTPIDVDVLANDIIPAAADTTITIVGTVQHGTVVVNSKNTVTVTPALNYEGEIKFQYIVCAVTGTFSVCDTADVCVTVKDTSCFIPNAFSPNGDGVNDLFVIPCNDQFEKASLRIFNRWGVEVWFSQGHYLDDFAGKNMQGTELPDGTYYLIYEYNDGSGRREAKFVVVNR